MSTDFLDESKMWRKCEIAWSAWLVAQGWMVIPLGDLNANSNSAPLTSIGGGAVRTPDILSTQGGNNIYWEVKYRTRSHINALTGQLEHWISLKAFNDYLIFAQKSNAIVKIILYEGQQTSTSSRWLEIDIQTLQDVGRKENRFSNAGLSIEAWIWPVSCMRIVEGPNVPTGLEGAPLLPEESGGVPMNPVELLPIERSLRKVKDLSGAAESEGSRNITFEKILAEDPVVGLDLLRRSLGISRIPKYSVLRIGAQEEDIEEILGLLDYGIRVFLITKFEIDFMMNKLEIDAFLESRMLEKSVLKDLADNPGWVVDGEPCDGYVLNLDTLKKAENAGGFNFHQYEIVHANTQDDILVTAGAGTGKTETLSERIVFLLCTFSGLSGDENQSPVNLSLNEIVLMTFTREGAIEIRKRLSSTLILRRRLAHRCVMPTVSWLLDLSMTQIGTIHGYAKHLLQEIGTVVGLTPNFRVSSATMDFRRLVHAELNAGLEMLYQSDDKGEVPAAHEWEDFIEQLWQSLNNNGWRISTDEIDWGQGRDEFQKNVVSLVTSSLKKLSRSYSDYCKLNQLLPTGDLVPKALECVAISVKGMKRFPRFIFIDEFQDTDSTQMDFILEMQSKFGANLYVVGDAKQGIYRFRGAEGSAFSELRNRVEVRKNRAFLEFKLVTNFRSDKHLLDSLHPLFSELGKKKFLSYSNADRLMPNPTRLSDGKAINVTLVKGAEKLTSVENQVKSWRNSKDSTDIALLCRDNWQAVELRNYLVSRGIPCELSIKGNFYQSPVVLEFRILLEALCNPADNAALLELLETRWSGGISQGQPPVGLDESDFGCWQAKFPKIMSWNDRFASVPGDKNFVVTDLTTLRLRVQSLSKLSKKISPIDFLFTLGRALSPESCSLLSDIPGDDTELRRYRRGWDHLISTLDSKFGRTPTTLHGLLSWLKLQIATNTTEDEPLNVEDLAGKVTALTVHKSKGLEFEYVLVPFTDKEFKPRRRKREIRSTAIRSHNGKKSFLWEWTPGSVNTTFTNSDGSAAWSIDEEEMIKEEARLLYVALTRSKNQLEVFVSSDAPISKNVEPNTWRDLIFLGSLN